MPREDERSAAISDLLDGLRRYRYDGAGSSARATDGRVMDAIELLAEEIVVLRSRLLNHTHSHPHGRPVQHA